MRILITNDDGINYDGLNGVVAWAKKHGEVTVVAPKFEQSGKSHGIELHKPFEVKRVERWEGVESYSVDSTPADCIRFAVLGLKRDFDLVLSGINNGLNIGCDMIYSGTVAAVFEAAALGIKAVAVSADFGKHEVAAEAMDLVFDYFDEHGLLEINNIYNVNVPENNKGILITRQGGPYYSDEFEPRENDLFMPIGKRVYEEKPTDELDTDAVMHGYISITPLTLDRTANGAYDKLVELNK